MILPVLAFFASVLAAAYLQQPYVLAFVPAVLMAYGLVQHPVLLFYLLIATIPWSVEYQFSNGLGTDLPDEPLMLLCAFAVVVCLAFQRRLRSFNPHPLLIVLLLHFVWLVIAAYTSTDRVLSVKYLLAKSWYLLAFTGGTLVLIRRPEQVRKAAVILFVSMMAATVTALVRHATYGFTFESVNWALEPFFRNHVNYSALLVFMLPLQIAFWGNRKYRKLLGVMMLLTVVALYLSYSRGAWLATVTGLAAYVLIKKKMLVFSFVMTVLLTIGVLFWLAKDDRYLRFAHDFNTTVFHEDFSEHIEATYQLKDASTAERFYRWIAGVRMVPDQWQTGYGPNTFYGHYKSYAVPAFKTWISKNEERSTVHNYFLLQAIETGIPGVILFLFLLGMMFFYAQRIYHSTGDPFQKTMSATIASLLTMICTLNFLSDLIEADKVGSVFYICIGLLVITAKARRREDMFEVSADETNCQ
jgi:O-antigen ligase